MSEKKPWEDAKTSTEMNKILRPKESSRMSEAEPKPPKPKELPSTRIRPPRQDEDPSSSLAEREAERLERRNRTVAKHVGGQKPEK